MTGPTKKMADPRDSYKQPQRKNVHDTSHRHDNKHGLPPFAVMAAAAAAATSSAETIDPNAFNASEVVTFLNLRYSDTLTAFHDTNLSPSLRPEKYESQQRGWGRVPVKGAMMATGLDFASELMHRAR
ncbi:hypothetical protein BDF14DRAFT_1749590 [Spinellus fusiger]|nr:hypothetical protein BDF14DRAFT_1749590 [Spinellus fusiger]